MKNILIISIAILALSSCVNNNLHTNIDVNNENVGILRNDTVFMNTKHLYYPYFRDHIWININDKTFVPNDKLFSSK